MFVVESAYSTVSVCEIVTLLKRVIIGVLWKGIVEEGIVPRDYSYGRDTQIVFLEWDGVIGESRNDGFDHLKTGIRHDCC